MKVIAINCTIWDNFKITLVCVRIRENYLFECTCNRCVVESQQPDLPSSSESEDDDSMDVDDWRFKIMALS